MRRRRVAAPLVAEASVAGPALGADGEPIEASETVQDDSDEQSR